MSDFSSRCNENLVLKKYVRCDQHTYRLRDEEVRRRVGVKENMSDRTDQKVMQWFEHLKHVSGKGSTKTVHMSEVEGRRERKALQEVAGRSLKITRGISRQDMRR